jgi:hypothetical protein
MRDQTIYSHAPPFFPSFFFFFLNSLFCLTHSHDNPYLLKNHIPLKSTTNYKKALIDKVQKTLAKKIKEEAGGTEVERLYDLLRSATRTVVALDSALKNYDDNSSSPKFKSLLEIVMRDEKLRALAEAIKIDG